MNRKQAKKELAELKRTKKDKMKRPYFSTLNRVIEGMLTPEEGIELLQDGNEAFVEYQTTIIKSGLKHGRLPRKRKSVRYDLWE